MVSGFVEDRLLKCTAWLFAAALLVHNMDHLRRGLKVLTPEVLWAGIALNIAAVAVIAIVVARREWASAAAAGVGFFMAIGVTASHLLPHWGVFSDAFPGSHVDIWSYAAVLFEIGASALFGFVGTRGLISGHRPAR
jgi:hypothetical protein